MTVMRSLVDDSRREQVSQEEDDDDDDRRLSQRIYQEIQDDDQSQHHQHLIQRDQKEGNDYDDEGLYNGSRSEEYRGEHDPLVSSSSTSAHPTSGMTEPDVAVSSTLRRDMTQSDATQLLNERISRRRRLREELRRRRDEQESVGLLRQQPSCSTGLSSLHRNLLSSTSSSNRLQSNFKSSGRSSDQEPIYHSMSPSSSHASEDYEDIQ